MTSVSITRGLARMWLETFLKARDLANLQLDMAYMFRGLAHEYREKAIESSRAAGAAALKHARFVDMEAPDALDVITPKILAALEARCDEEVEAAQ